MLFPHSIVSTSQGRSSGAISYKIAITTESLDDQDSNGKYSCEVYHEFMKRCK